MEKNIGWESKPHAHPPTHSGQVFSICAGTKSAAN